MSRMYVRKYKTIFYTFGIQINEHIINLWEIEFS